MADEELIRVEAPELGDLLRATREFDKTLYAGLRKALRESGEKALRESRAIVLQAPPRSSGPPVRRPSFGRSVGTRAAIARALSVSITNSARSTAVTLRASQRRMPRGRGPMVKAYNSRQFRHPVFADPSRGRESWAWATQAGRPYFGVIYRHRNQMTRAIADAMDDAARSMDRAMERVG